MSTELKHYLQDGANKQARAVMAMLQNDIELAGAHPWDGPKIARWENCREQGYIITLRTRNDTLHIAFFEHRNSDSICAIRWTQHTTNSPTIDTAEFGDQCYRDKWDVSHQVNYGQIVEMANWIEDQLQAFWHEQSRPADKGEEQPTPQP